MTPSSPVSARGEQGKGSPGLCVKSRGLREPGAQKHPDSSAYGRAGSVRGAWLQTPFLHQLDGQHQDSARPSGAHTHARSRPATCHCFHRSLLQCHRIRASFPGHSIQTSAIHPTIHSLSLPQCPTTCRIYLFGTLPALERELWGSGPLSLLFPAAAPLPATVPGTQQTLSDTCHLNNAQLHVKGRVT